MNQGQNLQTQTDMKSNYNTAKPRWTYRKMENLNQLRKENSQLAKELDEHKAIIRDLTRDRDETQRELIREKAFTRKIMECVKDIQLSAQINLTNLVSSSNCVTDILKMTHTLDTFNKRDRSIHTGLSENVAIISSDVLKPNISNPNIFNEITRRNTSQFTSLNPLSFLLNLDHNNADEALPVPKNFQSSTLRKEDQHIESGEIDKDNCLDPIAEDSRSILAGRLRQTKEPSGGLLSNDVSTCPPLELTIPTESKSLRAETSIQRRSNSLSEEDQIELIDDSEIISPHVPLLSSTIITSSPSHVQDFRITRSSENRRKSSSMQNEIENSELRKSQPSLFSSKTTTISDNLRLDSGNPTISKLDALMSSATTLVPSKAKVNTKANVKKAKRQKRRTGGLDQITRFYSPTIINPLAIRSFRKCKELRSKKTLKVGRRKLKNKWSESYTPKVLRPKTGSLKEPDLRSKLTR